MAGTMTKTERLRMCPSFSSEYAGAVHHRGGLADLPDFIDKSDILEMTRYLMKVHDSLLLSDEVFVRFVSQALALYLEISLDRETSKLSARFCERVLDRFAGARG